MQTCNKSSAPQLTVHVTKMEKISIYFAFIYIAYARSYRHSNSNVSLKRKHIYIVLIVRLQTFVDLQSNGVDVMVNGSQEYLVEIEIIDNLLRENRHLKGRGEYSK